MLNGRIGGILCTKLLEFYLTAVARPYRTVRSGGRRPLVLSYRYGAVPYKNQDPIPRLRDQMN